MVNNFSIKIKDQVINNLSIDEIEKMIIDKKVDIGKSLILPEGEEEWDTIYSFYIHKNLIIKENLKLIFYVQKIINHLDALNTAISFIKDDMDDKENIENWLNKSIETIYEIKKMVVNYPI